MGKKVNKWLKKGWKNCRKGNHWYILQYPEVLICPVCGDKKAYEGMMPEYNAYIVLKPDFVQNIDEGSVGLRKRVEALENALPKLTLRLQNQVGRIRVLYQGNEKHAREISQLWNTYKAQRVSCEDENEKRRTEIKNRHSFIQVLQNEVELLNKGRLARLKKRSKRKGYRTRESYLSTDPAKRDNSLANLKQGKNGARKKK